MNYFDEIKKGFVKHEEGRVIYYTVPQITATNHYIHGFSTRLGGVSPFPYSSMNLSLTREKNRANVKTNYETFANTLGLSLETFTSCHYKHGANVEILLKEDMGAGINQQNTLPFCDGVIIKEPGITAVTLHADCIPLFFADKYKRAAGVCHAGWKGTYNRICQNMIRAFDALHINPADILVGIGPSIGSCCFEVQDDVKKPFLDEYGKSILEIRQGKQFIDLVKVTAFQLKDAGVLSKNVTLSGLCTSCNKDLFFSHRRDKGRTGAMVSVIAIK
jgi:YfiH family protein